MEQAAKAYLGVARVSTMPSLYKRDTRRWIDQVIQFFGEPPLTVAVWAPAAVRRPRRARSGRRDGAR